MTILIDWNARLRTSAKDDKMFIANFGLVHIEYEICIKLFTVYFK